MGSVANGLANTFRYLPQHTIEGIFGRYAPKVEGFLGMSPAPVEGSENLQAPAMPDPNYHADKLAEANRSFLPKPDVTTMRKPLPKGK